MRPSARGFDAFGQQSAVHRRAWEEKMKTARVTLPLTLEQCEILAAAVDIEFKSDYLPLELVLGLMCEPRQASDDETGLRAGINRLVVTDGVIKSTA
jgi:hypothetical protein